MRSKLLIENHEIVDKFTRIGDGMGKAALYQAYYNNGTVSMELFFVNTLRSWVIGRHGKEIQIAMHLESNSRDPQENTDGIHILVGSSELSGLQWELDPDLQFRCETERNTSRNKRAFWLISLGITALVTTVTTTVTQGVAQQKGCLFYPSVCEMIDEITGSLSPKSKKLRSELKREMEEIGWTNLSSQLESTQTNYRRLIFLMNKLNKMTDISNFTELSEFYPNTFLTHYQEWLQDTSIAYVMGLFESGFEFLILFNLMVSTVTQTTAMILSGLVFVLGIVTSESVLLNQITEERNVRDKLRQNKISLEHAIDVMEKNKRQIELFKLKYIEQIVNPLQSLVAPFQKEFPSLHLYLQNLNNTKNIKYRYTRDINSHLQKLISFIERDLERADSIIRQYELFNATLNVLKNDIADKKQPINIITKIHDIYHNTSLPTIFNSTFDLLQYIAVNLTTNVSSCYWGIRMDLIRSGVLGRNTYTSVPLCWSPELGEHERTIRTNVIQTIAPCRIFRQLEGEIFNSMSKLIKFIADFILPNKDCYWGYDLVYIRNASRPLPVLESMQLHYKTFLYIDVAMHFNVSTSKVFQEMCESYGICKQMWQKFVFCSVRPVPGNNIHICVEEVASDCRNMTSVYVKDSSC
ncbi:uncharacterized protein LOC110463862 isoform X2 [Mizuhopecten yessoensis]|nr:uncharacterized protein LOC110463862 isoform X2 [Mizuhopecten yessoensis]XP_021374441.1 uncharacterized protein LOC110463862 isoform X2 [Mizuhopecten yessoensis]